MKFFEGMEDQKLNELAVSYTMGNEGALEEFFEIVMPKLEVFARRKYSHLEKEDLVGEFYVKAMEVVLTYKERYYGKANIMSIIYKSCSNLLNDLGDKERTGKRSTRVEVNGEIIERQSSLNSTPQDLNNDGSSSELGDSIAIDQPTVEEELIQIRNKHVLEEVISEFKVIAKGRNAVLVPLIVKAKLEDWTTEELQEQISEILEVESGVIPNNATIRKAQSRALEALRKAIITGKLSSAMKLEWDF